MFSSAEEVKQVLEGQNYFAEDDVAALVYLASVLEKPLLVEGPAGVGKTQLALALASATGRQLIRLQCFEGIDSSRALYDWNYHRQILRIQAGQGEGWEHAAVDVFSREFLVERPLLKAILSPIPSILLIDELDKSSEEFESFLLELLAEFQVTIPEIGTLKAVHKPMIILTSNGCRDFGDALRRRCLHLSINYPDLNREKIIVAGHCPEIAPGITRQAVELVHRLRKLPLRKAPSVAESIDFVRAINALGNENDFSNNAGIAAGSLLKYPQDVDLAMDKIIKPLGTRSDA